MTRAVSAIDHTSDVGTPHSACLCGGLIHSQSLLMVQFWINTRGKNGSMKLKFIDLSLTNVAISQPAPVGTDWPEYYKKLGKLCRVSDLNPADHWWMLQCVHTTVCLSWVKNELPHSDHFLSRPTKVQTTNEFSRDPLTDSVIKLLHTVLQIQSLLCLTNTPLPPLLPLAVCADC